MKIDNFDIIRRHLTFEPAMKFDAETKKLKKLNDTYDRYIVQILKRAKDSGGKEYGVNTINRLIKTYEISSLEYFDRKKSHIIDLCESNVARAYILPQVRSTYDCLKEMIKLGVDNLENPTIKFQHIMRSCMCAMHKSRDKRWIIDLDGDNMTEYTHPRNRKDEIKTTVWTVEDVENLIASELEKIGKSRNDMYTLKTPHGHTIVTSPFNLQSAYEKCNMLYSGVQTKDAETVYTGPGEYETVSKRLTGWVIKDGMALLYFNGDKK